MNHVPLADIVRNDWDQIPNLKLAGIDTQIVIALISPGIAAIEGIVSGTVTVDALHLTLQVMIGECFLFRS